MIVAEIKPFKEIKQNLGESKKICIIGCEACVSICHAGGKKQVSEMASQLRLSAKLEGKSVEVSEDSIQRQCEWEFIEPVKDSVSNYDAIVSLACGIGVQFMAERYPQVKVQPGLNTTFMGAPTEPGVFWERCVGCGNCVLAETGGLCPISRCAKNLLNGPCGGSKNSECEIGNDTPCVWHQIYDQLEKKGSLQVLEQITDAKDWSTSTNNQPRRMELNHLKNLEASV